MDLVASVCVKDKRERRIKHYSSSHKILLVGEGDFSFSVSLANAFGSAVNMVATSLDSRVMLLSKYTLASGNLKKLEDLGCTLIHQVDANTMGQHSLLGHKLFDRIVFNFPHAGFIFQEHNALQIELHQDVVRVFFRSARAMLAENGEIHVTHKTAHPFSRWKIEELAGEVELCLVEKVPFRLSDYPGYRNKKGSGKKTNRTFPVGECSTFKFAHKPPPRAVLCQISYSKKYRKRIRKEMRDKI